tara:strand:+ start:528 stop:1601 length:1074 start_codon:yes stop_codon:yes gene_type:complete
VKILSIVGARPQFIKLAPISKKIKSSINHVVIHTGQHFDKNMSDIFFDEMSLKKPKYNLNISRGSHADQTGLMLIEIEKILITEKPDLVIIFGDTNSTLAGALAASKLGIKLVHIEAGLRSFNKMMPEEINRIIADHTSDFLFAPTDAAMNNIKDEGLINKAYLTGDVMVDSVNLFLKKAQSKSEILLKLGLNKSDYSLLTLHRPYNVDDPDKLSNIITFLNELCSPFIFPIHPRTRQIISKFNIQIGKNIKLIEPVGYLDFLILQNNANKIFTDSGGIQKEAYILKTPCVTIRTETEWVETVSSGWNKLINPNQINLSDLVDEINLFNPDDSKYDYIFGNNVTENMLEKIYEIITD